MEECNCLKCEKRTLQELYEEEGAEIMEQHKHKKAKRVVKKEKDNPPSVLTHEELVKLTPKYCAMIFEDVQTRAEAITLAAHIQNAISAETYFYAQKKRASY